MRARRLAGLALLSLGLLLSVASYLMVEEALREATVGIYSEPMWYQFWAPHTYTLVEVPSYTFMNLYVGAASLTAGCILVFGAPAVQGRRDRGTGMRLSREHERVG